MYEARVIQQGMRKHFAALEVRRMEDSAIGPRRNCGACRNRPWRNTRQKHNPAGEAPQATYNNWNKYNGNLLASLYAKLDR